MKRLTTLQILSLIASGLNIIILTGMLLTHNKIVNNKDRQIKLLKQLCAEYSSSYNLVTRYETGQESKTHIDIFKYEAESVENESNDTFYCYYIVKDTMIAPNH